MGRSCSRPAFWGWDRPFTNEVALSPHFGGGRDRLAGSCCLSCVALTLISVVALILYPVRCWLSHVAFGPHLGGGRDLVSHWWLLR